MVRLPPAEKLSLVLRKNNTTFVFSLIIFAAYAAQPLVFPDLDLPATEMWRIHSLAFVRGLIRII
ncbi:hypothetical protein HYQ46_013248 [Verticillium longisporum]|nr:hypothetical protein HYQ46_013248 [Verticillium longisporum]